MPALKQEASGSTKRFGTARAFETWMRRNHAARDGVWLLIAKAGAEARTVTYADAVEIALCYGWVDGQKKALDDQHWLQRFTPRRARSLWSKINRAKAEALIEAGRMQPAGLAEIVCVLLVGCWVVVFDGARTSEVPDDLRAALDAAPPARAFFGTLDAANRYAVLWRVQTAARPETRSKRISMLVAMLARGEKIHR